MLKDTLVRERLSEPDGLVPGRSRPWKELRINHQSKAVRVETPFKWFKVKWSWLCKFNSNAQITNHIAVCTKPPFFPSHFSIFFHPPPFIFPFPPPPFIFPFPFLSLFSLFCLPVDFLFFLNTLRSTSRLEFECQTSLKLALAQAPEPAWYLPWTSR